MKYGDFLVEQMFSHPEKVDAIERYISLNGKKSFHTDEIRFIESHEAHDQAEVLDWKVMGKAEDMSTIEANSSFKPEEFDDWIGADGKVLVVLLE